MNRLKELTKELWPLIESIAEQFTKDERQAFIEEVRFRLHGRSPLKHHPVDYVQWMPSEMVVANDYNPNSVAPNELRLLYTSIKADGYTQPIVTVWDDQKGKYVVVDGFHRCYVMKTFEDIAESTNGMLPIVVIDKSLADRMASTIRHNRARGKHAITGMAQLVFNMLAEGVSDEQICKELGLEVDELVRLKHVTGFSKLFEGVEYNKAWKMDTQLRVEKEYKNGLGDSQKEAECDSAVLEESETQP